MADLVSQSETLPFSNPKQEALMGYLLMDQRFFRAANLRIKSEWWGSLRLQQVWGMLQRLAKTYARPMTISEVGECREMLAMDPTEATRLRSLMSLCVTRRQEFGLDILQQDLTDWLRCRIYLEQMKKSEGLFNLAAKGGGADRQKLVQAFEAIKKMTKEIDEATFEAGVVEPMEIEDLEKAQVDNTHAVSFGLPKLDAFLNDGNSEGGLLKGDMTVLLAPSNVGKTSTMVTAVAANILLGHDVLWITHEGRVSDLKVKMWEALMEETRPSLFKNMYQPQFRAALEMCKEKMRKHLIFMPLNKAGLTVEEVEVAIRRQQDLWQSEHMGKGFDLIVDDYAAKLTTTQARGGNFALRHIHEIVYNYFSQIALEHDAHVLTAIQANREGSKVNSRLGKAVESRFLTMEDVSESWGPMTTATTVISINRPPVARAKDVTGFYVGKSRSSETGVVFMAQSNFACSRTHWPTTDCQEFKLYGAASERVEDLLKGMEKLEDQQEAEAA